MIYYKGHKEKISLFQVLSFMTFVSFVFEMINPLKVVCYYWKVTSAGMPGLS